MRRWSDKLFLTFLPTFGNFQRLKETSLILLIIWSIMVISRWLTANKNIECLCKQIYDNRRIYQLSFCLEGTTWWQGLVLVSPLYRSKESLATKVWSCFRLFLRPSPSRCHFTLRFCGVHTYWTVRLKSLLFVSSFVQSYSRTPSVVLGHFFFLTCFYRWFFRVVFCERGD